MLLEHPGLIASHDLYKAASIWLLPETVTLMQHRDVNLATIQQGLLGGVSGKPRGFLCIHLPNVQALYGDRVWQFSKFPIAMLSLFRLMLADSELDYETLFRINADYTPLYYFLFQFVFLVLVMNMLIAILVSQFEAVKDLSTSEEKWKKEVPSLTSDVATLFHIYTYRCRNRCCRNEHALKMTESIKSARSLYAEDPIKWGEAYTKSCAYWKGCE
jgi:hypothetical protein